MTYKEFVELVQEMRQAQTTYFRETKKRGERRDEVAVKDALMRSMRLEKLVDNVILERKFHDDKAEEKQYLVFPEVEI